MSHRIYIERLVITLAILAVALLLWQLRSVLILVFGAVLVAVILQATADPFRRRGMGKGWAMFLAILLVLGGLALAFFTFGTQVAGQTQQLSQKVPQAWAQLQQWMGSWGIGGVQESFQQISSQFLSSMGGFASSLGGGIADAVLVIVGGIYMAVQPTLYRKGLLKLVPPGGRELTGQALEDSAKGLRLWLFGQLISMVIVGVLTGVGLWLLGVPLALTLGILAGLLDFVPIVGPLAAAVPGILLALMVSPELALWTAGLYLLVQQIEGNIVAPIVQQRAVDLPPALLLFSLVAFGLLFGIPGVLFAAPLTVVLFIMVKRLYVREALNTPTPLPTEPEGHQEEAEYPLRKDP